MVSPPTYQRFLVLVLAAVLTTGRRTITNLQRTVCSQAPGHMSSYQRVFSQLRWSTWELARALITFLLDRVVPPGPVLLAGDDPVTEHPGPKVCGKGRHGAGVRSTHSYTAYRWGHTWVVVSGLVKLPFATRPWALPVLVALYRPPKWDRVHGRRHKTPAHLARLLLARLVRWFPERHFSFVGDAGYGTSETARFCRQRQCHLTVVSTFYGDAALYVPPPPRTRRTRLAVAWYGGTSRDIEVVTGVGPWYRIGEDLVAIRGVYVHDGTGTHRDEYLFTTELSLCPKQIVECSTQRGSIETTVQECREHLKLESTKCYRQPTVLRFTPCLFGLYTIVVLLYLQLPDLLRLPLMMSWSGKSTTTFADMITWVRRAIWQQWCFQTSTKAAPFSKLPRSLQDTILYDLDPAA